MLERVRTVDAAKEIGCNPQFLRERVKAGDWDLGSYIKPKGRKTGTCYVFRGKLDAFLGKTQKGQKDEEQEIEAISKRTG